MLIVLLIAALLNVVYGQVVVDDVNTPFYVKPGELVKAKVFLYNFGDVDERVHASIVVSGKDYYHEYKTSPLIVRTDNTQMMVIYFKAPEQEGEYTLKVKAYTDDHYFDDEYNFKVIGESKDFEVSLCSDEPVVERGSQGSVDICIANTGTEMEDFTVLLSNWTEYFIDEPSFTLSPSEEKRVSIELPVDSTKSVGVYDVNVEIRAVRAQVSKNVTFKLYVVGSDKAKTLIETNVSTTSTIAGDTVVLNMSIVNKGLPNVYKINVTYPQNWTGNEINSFAVFLPTNGRKIITMEFTPKEEGSYPISIEVATDEGIIFKKDFVINSFGGKLGINSLTGSFYRVVKSRIPLYAFIVLVTLGVVFLLLTYYYNKSYYYIYPKRGEKDKDIKIDLQ